MKDEVRMVFVTVLTQKQNDLCRNEVNSREHKIIQSMYLYPYMFCSHSGALHICRVLWDTAIKKMFSVNFFQVSFFISINLVAINLALGNLQTRSLIVTMVFCN